MFVLYLNTIIQEVEHPGIFDVIQGKQTKNTTYAAALTACFHSLQ